MGTTQSNEGTLCSVAPPRPWQPQLAYPIFAQNVDKIKEHCEFTLLPRGCRHNNQVLGDFGLALNCELQRWGARGIT